MAYEDNTSCWRDGWFAHKNGIAVEDNPYDELKQAISHRLWLSGWSARFGEVKHGSGREPELTDAKYSLWDGAWS